MKVEQKYETAETKEYVFPKKEDVSFSKDSNSSFKSLENIQFYDLERQNDKKNLSSLEQLVEVIFELREIEKPRIYKLLE